jgi:hypothetical protein
MHDPDYDLFDTDELLDDLGYTELDPLPAHLDPDRLSPCDTIVDSDSFDDQDLDSTEGFPIPPGEGVPTEELPY